MIHVREKFELPAAPEEVWNLLSDPARVAPCITGATLGSLNSNGRYPGTMSVRFGPTVVAFRGEVGLGYDHAARICTIEGRGADQKGVSNASASWIVKVTGDIGTTVDVDGRFDLTGPLAAFARTGGVHVARALLADFFANVAARLQGANAETAEQARADSPPNPRAELAPVPAAASLNGAAFLWRVLRDVLRRMFKRPT
jgi:carbon monoxide dehydrogenase subunit G